MTAPPAPRHRLRQFRIAGVVALILGALVAVVALGLQARQSLDELRTAGLDNVQWTASQLEVDILRLILALREAEIALDEGEDVTEAMQTVHLRFDIMYSRLGALTRGTPYQSLQGTPAAIADLDRLRTVATALAARFDAGDEALLAALPEIRAELVGWHLIARRLVLRVLELFSQISDQERAAFGDLIGNIALLGLGLLTVMTALVLGLLRLQSRQRQTAAALRDARDAALAGERMKSEFIAVMSHEMRTPLNGTLAALDLAAAWARDGAGRPPSDLAGLIGVARDGAEQLLDRLNEVLDIARLEAGRTDPVPAPFRPGPLLEGLAEAIGPLAAARGNRLILQLDPALATAYLGDAQMIRQALLNLLGNAVKFTENGTITLAAAPDGTETVVFSVTDTGPGIAPADQDRIFDDFVMIDSGYERHSRGSGLGLGICRRLAAAMGGTVELSSTPGRGSSFRLRLPLAATNAVAPSQPAAALPAAPAGPPEPLSVLVVEDNPTNRELLVRMLEAEGHRATAAATGTEGVALATGRRFDAVFMDISMPGMDGIAATAAIRAGGASHRAPVYAVTAHAMPAEQSRFLAAGMRLRLRKPIRLEDLRAVLAEVSGEAGLEGGCVPAAHPPEAATEETELPVMDAAAAGELLGGMAAADIAAIAALFAADSDTTLRDLQSEAGRIARQPGAAGASAKRIRDLAHQWRGAAATLGCRRLADRLALLEQAAAAPAPDLDDVQDRIGALASLWAETRGCLPLPVAAKQPAT